MNHPKMTETTYSISLSSHYFEKRRLAKEENPSCLQKNVILLTAIMIKIKA